MRLAAIATTAALALAAVSPFLAHGALSARDAGTILPNDWIVRPPRGTMTMTDTMPQGAAASPDGKTLAVVESGYNPATLRLYRTSDLEQTASISLAGAFGRPAWRDATHVLVAGANADAVFDVDVATQTARAIAFPAKSYPLGVVAAPGGGTFAVATDGDRSVRVGTLEDLAAAHPVDIGGHPGGLAFSPDGKSLFAATRESNYVSEIDLSTMHARRIVTGLHPTDLLVADNELYVAQSDADSVGIYSVADGKPVDTIFVGDSAGGTRLAGTSPNAIARSGDEFFVSLGAANSVAVLRHHRLAGRMEAGWYPTDVVPIGRRLYVIDGKGEGMHSNVHFDPFAKGDYDYIGTIQYGSIRVYEQSSALAASGNPQGAEGWRVDPDSVVRANGPIRHVFFILKENRSYDQVLGDVPQGNGDPKLVWFGAKATPNQHAIARRFGLFDNAYASGEVSDSGHNWADGAFANDYVERFWPLTYGGRRVNDDVLNGEGAGVAAHGYMWDEAARSHVSFRDYGELADNPTPRHRTTGATAPTLRGRFDPNYVGWDLNYSDVDRAKEWKREFTAFVRTNTLPQLEYIWLPNDHTSGARVGKLTPASYVAQNDYGVGLIIDAISHSPVWKSSAVFIIEDDAQDGADHVSAQRTTLYVASPYARGGVRHEHYSTVSVLRTIELMLGMKPLSTYDAMATPMYAAFSSTPILTPYTVIPPQISTTARNTKDSYGARVSASLDFSRPDAAPAGTLLDILAHGRAAGSH